MKPITIALAGNPNSGKTTVFNALTGSHQRTGNWPGVTVERKEGEYRLGDIRVNVVDLPGSYGLSAYSIDERIARDYLVTENPDVVVTIVDASNLERNLYLVIQLLELGQNVVVCLNMMDLARKSGMEIDPERLSELLGVPVVPTVAHKGEGIEELRKVISESAEGGDSKRSPRAVNYGEELEETIGEIERILSPVETPYPLRFMAIKLLEDDPDMGELLTDGMRREIGQILSDLEKKLGEDPETLIAERRYGFIHGLVRECLRRRPSLEGKITFSDRLDKIVTNRFLGIPIFLLFMWLTFQLVFRLGNPIADLVDAGFGWLGGWSGSVLESIGAPVWLRSLISDGLIAGVGSVLVFLPNILLLFLIFAFLEDSGYMARAAFVMDRVMHALGLHGKSFIPMLLGFGCNVPAIMGTRILESRKDRILTILVNPLMSCSARLPIYTLFAGIFFARHQGLVVFSLYLMGIILAILVARIFKSLFFKEEVAPFIMELPPYRMPIPKNVLFLMWTRSSMFLRKAGTVILAGVILIWLLAYLPPGVEYGSAQSLIGRLGHVFAPMLAPSGFGFWQAAVALIFGIIAKEVVVGTLGTLYGGEEHLSTALAGSFTPLSAYAFMVMSLIYIPCIATIAVIKREAGWRWTGLAVGYSLMLGWLVAVIVYQVGRAF
jgi:ferrous iron transport protein B